MKFIVLLFLCISGFCQDIVPDYDVTDVMPDVRRSLEEYMVALRATTNDAERDQVILEFRFQHSMRAAKFMSALSLEKGAESLDVQYMYQFFDKKQCFFDVVFRLGMQPLERLQKKIETMSYPELEQHLSQRDGMCY